jgi:hypothetical protein
LAIPETIKQQKENKKMKLTIILSSAHAGLSTAVILLNKKGTKKAKDLAKILDAADKGILNYLTSGDDS